MLTLDVKKQYDDYLTNHIDGVRKAFNWISENIPDAIDDVSYELNYRSRYETVSKMNDLINSHDASKYSDEEYEPYANWFYGDEKSKEDFDIAWLHHQKVNPHHWQYWILINDEDGIECMDMPMMYIIEMICDWWSFSWSKGNLYEILDWYKQHKGSIMLSDTTRDRVETLIDSIISKLSLDSIN